MLSHCTRFQNIPRPLAPLVVAAWIILHAAMVHASPESPDQGKEMTSSVEQAFSFFADTWLRNQGRELLARPEAPELTRTRDGFLARVVRIDPASKAVSVESTGTPDTPYLGILTYLVRTSISRAENRENALKGPFLPEEVVHTTEIFLFQNGQWGTR